MVVEHLCSLDEACEMSAGGLRWLNLGDAARDTIRRRISESLPPGGVPRSGPILTLRTLSAVLNYDNPLQYPVSDLHHALEDPESDLDGLSNARVCDMTCYNRSGACYFVPLCR